MALAIFFFFQAEDGIRDKLVTGVQTCALPIWPGRFAGRPGGPHLERPVPDDFPGARRAQDRGASDRGGARAGAVTAARAAGPGRARPPSHAGLLASRASGPRRPPSRIAPPRVVSRAASRSRAIPSRSDRTPPRRGRGWCGSAPSLAAARAAARRRGLGSLLRLAIQLKLPPAAGLVVEGLRGGAEDLRRTGLVVVHRL